MGTRDRSGLLRVTLAELIVNNLDDPAHGSKSTYDRHKCRCESCRAANSNYMREYRKRRTA